MRPLPDLKSQVSQREKQTCWERAGRCERGKCVPWAEEFPFCYPRLTPSTQASAHNDSAPNMTMNRPVPGHARHPYVWASLK